MHEMINMPIKPYVQIFAGTETEFRQTRMTTTEEGPFYFSLQERHNGYHYFETLNAIYSIIKGSALTSAPEASILDMPKAGRAQIAGHKETAGFVSGVSATGAEIGNHVINNLLCILEAISRGVDDIVLLGHSRGAVSAIIVAHELQAIKDSSDLSLIAVLEKSNNKYFLDAVAKLTETQRQWLERNSDGIINGVKQAKFTLFAIDPVPGNDIFPANIYNFAMNPLPITWFDARYFVIPPIIARAEIITQEHEHSKGFRVIAPLPYDKSSTEFNNISLPGHHGTSIGNLNNHSGTVDMTPYVQDTQHLVMIKLVQLLKEHHFDLDDAVRKFDISKKKVLALYENMHKNRRFFESLREGSFLVGKEHDGNERKIWTGTSQNSESWDLPFGLGRVLKNFIAPMVPITKSFSDQFIHDKARFVNQEHAELLKSPSQTPTDSKILQQQSSATIEVSSNLLSSTGLFSKRNNSSCCGQIELSGSVANDLSALL